MTTSLRSLSHLFCEKALGNACRHVCVETVASAARNSAFPSVLPGQLVDLCSRPLDGPEQLDYVGKMI